MEFVTAVLLVNSRANIAVSVCKKFTAAVKATIQKSLFKQLADQAELWDVILQRKPCNVH